MKKLVIVGLTSMALFAISGAASWFLQQQKHAEKPAEADAKVVAGPGARGHGRGGAAGRGPSPGHEAAVAPEGDEPLRGGVRPPYNPGPEEIGRLTSELRSRIAKVREEEKRTAQRRKDLEVIQADIQSERGAIDDLRKQAKKELEAVQAALAELEKQHGSVKNEQGKVAQAARDLEGRKVEENRIEDANIKKIAMLLGAMSGESAAGILQKMADTGKMDTAVRVLGMMQEKQAAKVLAEIKDPSLPAQLLEKSKGLRRPAATAGLR